MPGVTNLFDVYLEAIRDAIKRGAKFIQLDKIHMIETWGDTTHGLVFYHNILARLSVELDLKFYLFTEHNNPTKFLIYFFEKDSELPLDE